ncbi:caspase-7-like isoform X3 [Paramacrobiotus metropolitanus]|uniref:caspase-7-like isoform X3 n=1 Tax=Paramacrobiotus metropolitanus TaxID=2943436 RepID=UPI0024462091|nr:caspase-7-like isoform X3 [Paramacrobiotus metropolitanus]
MAVPDRSIPEEEKMPALDDTTLDVDHLQILSDLELHSETTDEFLDFEWDDKHEERAASPVHSPGRVIIIQLKNYCAILKDKYRVSPRPEVDVDGATLNKLLTEAGCSVRLIKDPDCTDVSELLVEEANNLRQAAQHPKFFMLIVLSQSLQPLQANHEVVLLYDGFLTFTEIIQPFYEKANHTEKVAKVFIFHVPKCGKPDMGLTILRKKKLLASDENSANIAPLIPKEEIVLVHSTIGGCFAFRNPQSGSYFIKRFSQSLEFNVNHKEVDFLTLLTRLNGQIANYNPQPLLHDNSPDGNGTAIDKRSPSYQQSTRKSVKYCK